MSLKRKSLESVDFEKIIRSQQNKTVRNLPNFVIKIIRKVLREKGLNKWLNYSKGTFNIDFIKKSHEFFNVKVKTEGLENIDPNGRYIFVANHPIGGLDFSSTIYGMSEKFPDIRVIANKVLTELSNLEEMILPVGVFEKTNNEDSIKIEAVMTSDNFQIMTFPAGLVARKINRKVQDSKWHRSFIRHAVHYERDVVPVFIDSYNSKFFYRLGQVRKFFKIKANLEMFFIIGEQFKKKNSTIPVHFGKPISYKEFTDEKTHLEWAQKVKEELYSMQIKGEE
ncbi:MAG: hypothetical protein U9N85_04295 [Bacteroidota bacterium]|nr:hypothetical protein [Bacteroidota bacterium]